MIKDLYTNEVIQRYKNLQYWDNTIPNLTTTIKPSLPNCTVKLYLNITTDSNIIKQIKYHLSAEIFGFVFTELVIDQLVNKTITKAKNFIHNIDKDSYLNIFISNITIQKIIKYFSIALEQC